MNLKCQIKKKKNFITASLTLKEITITFIILLKNSSEGVRVRWLIFCEFRDFHVMISDLSVN